MCIQMKLKSLTVTLRTRIMHRQLQVLYRSLRYNSIFCDFGLIFIFKLLKFYENSAESNLAYSLNAFVTA